MKKSNFPFFKTVLALACSQAFISPLAYAKESAVDTVAVPVLADNDGDAIGNSLDNCPNVANPGQWDKDGDGIGNACDSDIDGDGHSNEDEIAAGTKVWDPSSKPKEPTGLDNDQDGIDNAYDNCIDIANVGQWDKDKDKIGNECDDDIDGDGFSNDDEVLAGTKVWDERDFPSTPDDQDKDGIKDDIDNCLGLYNPGQWDKDKDNIGNECDDDIDGDGYSNEEELAAGTKVWDARSPGINKPSTTWVYRSDKTQTCQVKRGEPISFGHNLLSDAEINVNCSLHSNDGLMRVDICGADSGNINAYQINNVDLSAALQLGFFDASGIESRQYEVLELAASEGCIDDNAQYELKDLCKGECSHEVVFSEAVSSNSLIEDQDGDSPDWFELHKPISSFGEDRLATSLTGWSITDDKDEPMKWVFGEYELPVEGYLQVWASKKDRRELNSDNKEFHTNFKISSKGEKLYLFDNEGQLVDAMYVPNTPRGHSVGLKRSSMMAFSKPTPGAANNSPSFQGIVENEISFSHQGGEVDGSLSLEISGAEESQEIRYTLDASIPNKNSILYKGPIEVTKNTVIRAQVQQEHYASSDTESRSYLVGVDHDLPVISLITDQANLFDEDTGIYAFGNSFSHEFPFFGANFWQDWERDVHFAFYETNGELGAEFDAGIQIFGGYTRGLPQRSLSLYARGRYGDKEFDYPFFDNVDYDEFQTLVLRNSGNDWLNGQMRDIVMTQVMADSGLDIQENKPTSVYINQDYWGMYNLREKINEHFIASKHDIDTDDIDIVEKAAEVIHGSNVEFLQLISYVQGNDLSKQEHYDFVSEQIDIDNYITYQLAQIYYDNSDWPGNNTKYWKSSETKWRWILFDTDFGLNLWGTDNYKNNSLAAALATNGPEWPNPPWSTLLFRKLVENEQFKTRFINLMADNINTRFQASNIAQVIDSAANKIQNEIPQHFARWAPEAGNASGADFQSWQMVISHMKDFAEHRASYVQNDIIEQFDLSTVNTLTINNATEQGEIALNSLSFDDEQWQGQYFADVPVTITAQAKPGYSFAGWSGASESTKQTIELNVDSDLELTPIYQLEP